MASNSDNRLIARLETAMTKAVHPVEQACLRAERAGQLARQGHFDLAQQELHSVQRLFERQPHPAVSAWVCIAEGWLAYFTNLSGSARDKLQRALALSAAARLPQLQALSAAWLAHMEYVAQTFEPMAVHVQQALSLAAPDHHSARSRACLVVAQALHFAERPELAQVWFSRSREHAGVEGDELTISALSHNKAWLDGWQAFQVRIMGALPDEQGRRALLAAQSTASFDQWTGTVSLHAFVPILRASIHSARDEPALALRLYEEHLAVALQQGLGRMSAHFWADMAYCEWRAGHAERAVGTAEKAQAALKLSMHPDDRATAELRLSQLRAEQGLESEAESHRRAAAQAWAEHQALQARALAAVAAVEPKLNG
jgi:hypothetical protein